MLRLTLCCGLKESPIPGKLDKMSSVKLINRSNFVISRIINKLRRSLNSTKIMCSLTSMMHLVTESILGKAR